VLALACTTRGRDAVPVRPLAEIPRRAVAATTLISVAPFLLVVVAILLVVGQQISPCLFPPLFSQRKQQRSRLQKNTKIWDGFANTSNNAEKIFSRFFNKVGSSC
jgi:hypothetical protein